MASGVGGYSRFVRILKIGLPLLSLAILSTLFLFSSRIDLNAPSPIDGIDVDRLVAEQGIGAPNFVGTTSNGGTIHLSAGRAIPDANDTGVFDVTEISARIDEPTGASLNFSAPLAALTAKTQSATFSGGVQMQSSEGLTIQTPQLSITDNFAEITADQKVYATAPFGTLEAGAMQISRAAENSDAAGYRFVFTNGVRLVYTPNN